jgi:hypothetical protein
MVVALVAVSSGMAVNATEVSAIETTEEDRKGGRGGGGRGGRRSGGTVYRGGTGYHGPYTSTGLMYPNEHDDRKFKKKCNRFVNWLKRLFNKKIKKCPKKGEEEEEKTLRRRA